MLYIYTNPVAGDGKTVKAMSYLSAMFYKNQIEFKERELKRPWDAYRLTKFTCQAYPWCEGIIVIGGDGTIQEMVAGMIDALEAYSLERCSMPLGILATGSGNDFIRCIETKKLPDSAILIADDFFEKLQRRETRAVDVITANNMAFLNIANIGLDARIVENAVGLKAKYGKRAYLAAVHQSIAEHENIDLKIEVDGKNLDGSYTLAAICNGQYYGGGLRIAPNAKIDDGKITLCLVEAMSRRKLTLLFPSLRIGMHKYLKAVKFIECEEVTITIPPQQNPPSKLCMDGNLYPIEEKTHFKIHPKILDVFV